MIQEHRVDSNGVGIHAVSEGKGPMVLMVHGFPGLAYSWRHQMAPLAAAGYRAVAIDCRGYGRSDRPVPASAYDSETYRKDLLAVIDHFGADKAVVIGQDFGAQHAWNIAIRSPERIAGVLGMVPYDMDLAGRGLARPGEQADAAAMAAAEIPPSARFAAMAAQHFVHVHYFQKVGPAEAELGPRTPAFLRKIFWALSAQGNLLNWANFPAEGTGYLDVIPEAPPLPWSWMSDDEFAHYVAEYDREGPELAFVGGLNSYRTADINWRIGDAWKDANVEIPSYFLAGAEDVVLKLVDPHWREKMAGRLPDLRGLELVEGAGHFVQQEKPDATNAAILKFLNGLERW